MNELTGPTIRRKADAIALLNLRWKVAKLQAQMDSDTRLIADLMRDKRELTEALQACVMTFGISWDGRALESPTLHKARTALVNTDAMRLVRGK